MTMSGMRGVLVLGAPSKTGLEGFLEGLTRGDYYARKTRRELAYQVKIATGGLRVKGIPVAHREDGLSWDAGPVVKGEYFVLGTRNTCKF